MMKEAIIDGIVILQELTVILSTLLPVVHINNDSKENSNYSVGLKVLLPFLLGADSLKCCAFYRFIVFL